MDDARLLSFIEKGEIVAAFLVVIGVAGEFMGSYLARPIRRRMDEARATEMAALTKASSEATERAEKLVADNLAVRGTVADLEKQAADARTRAAKAEQLLAEVNERTKDRHLQLDRRLGFVTALSRGRGEQIIVACSSVEYESKIFATELVAAFRDAGWNVADQTQDVRISGAQRGLFLTYGSLVTAEVRSAISEGFAAAGISVIHRSDNAGSPKLVRLEIGSK